MNFSFSEVKASVDRIGCMGSSLSAGAGVFYEAKNIMVLHTDNPKSKGEGFRNYEILGCRGEIVSEEDEDFEENYD